MILSGGMSVGSGIQIATEAPATDPYYNNVVLLIHPEGAVRAVNYVDSIDNSQYQRKPFELRDVNITNEQTLFGQNTLKSVPQGGDGSLLAYGYTTDFTVSNSFTLEFWAYAKSYGATFLSGFSAPYVTVTQVNPSLYSYNFIGYCPGAATAPTATFAPNTWNWIVLQQSGANYSTYVNGVRQTNGSDGTSAPVGARPMYVTTQTSHSGNSFDGYLSEIRFTQGVARYSGATIPVQSAPWPNS